MLENGRFRITVQADDTACLHKMEWANAGHMVCRQANYAGTYDDLRHAYHAATMNRWTVTEAFKVHKDGRVDEIEVNRDYTYTVGPTRASDWRP